MQTTTIHTDHNGVTVNAIDATADGTDVRGHVYHVLLGENDPAPLALVFQRGGVAVNGVNGITTEALLAVCIHRTEVMNGQFHSDENDLAIRAMREALANLEIRTRRRQARGVEGTPQL
jgi:hypothetical protein